MCCRRSGWRSRLLRPGHRFVSDQCYRFSYRSPAAKQVAGIGSRGSTGRHMNLEVHAYIEVADLERGMEFYCGGLGLSLKRRLSPSWVEFDGANLPVFLLGDRPPTAELGGTRVQRSFDCHW